MEPQKYILHKVDASDAAWRLDNFRFPENHGFDIEHDGDNIALLGCPHPDGSGITNTSWIVVRLSDGDQSSFCGVLTLSPRDSTQKVLDRIIEAFSYRPKFSYFNPKDDALCQSTFIP